jgi:transglutaminase-like putative cysteine protease
VKFRWDFSEDAASAAWQFTTLGIGLAGILIFLDETPYMALPSLLTWLPPLLLPMQFVQSYGLRDSLPLSTFSFLARYRHKRNLRLGLTEETIRIHFGNVYFVTTLIASTLGSQANSWPYSLMFLPGIIILTGWQFLAASRSHPLALVIALIVAGGISLAGQFGLDELADWFGNRGQSRSQFNPNSAPTMIGKPGRIQLSPDIVWRLRLHDDSPKPNLLRTGTYNILRGSTWQNMRVAVTDFRDLDNIEPTQGEIFYLLRDNLTPEAKREAIAPGLPRFSLRGTAFAETPLPVPGDTASLTDFELDAQQCNSLGSVRVFPKRSVIEGTVLWNGSTNPEVEPLANEDLVIPPPEREALQEALRQIRIDEQPTLEGKLRAIRGWFQQNFTYSRNLSINASHYLSNPHTALTQFLTTQQSGHCEYFATTTALLLREAGIPARYATGYAVIERDLKRQEYIIRGTHGHAWCRVWDADAGSWLDFDTTPGSWLDALRPQNTASQRFNDSVKRIREDFFLWRNRPANRLGATVVMLAILLAVTGYIAKRLWKSKRRMEAARKATRYTGPVVLTPLNALEPQAEKHLGSRPPGEPFAAWLMRLRPSLADSSVLEEAVELHQRLRFDPQPTPQTTRERLAELARDLESAIKRG